MSQKESPRTAQKGGKTEQPWTEDEDVTNAVASDGFDIGLENDLNL